MLRLIGIAILDSCLLWGAAHINVQWKSNDHCSKSMHNMWHKANINMAFGLCENLTR